jgi:hypothetical protein
MEATLASNGAALMEPQDSSPVAGGSLEQRLCRLEDAALVLLQVWRGAAGAGASAAGPLLNLQTGGGRGHASSAACR